MEWGRCVEDNGIAGGVDDDGSNADLRHRQGRSCRGRLCATYAIT